MGVSKEGRAKRDKLINSIIETNLDLNSDRKITFKKLARDAGYSNRKNIRSFPVDLNTPKENAHAYFNQLTSDLDQPLKNFKNIRDKISKKIKVPKQYVNLLLKSSERYQKLRPALLQINSPGKAAYFKKNKGTLFSEIVESIENRNKTLSNSPVFNKTGSYSKPEQKIMEYAKRHVNQGGKKIKFINTIDKDGFNEFLYKGKKYNINNLINEGRQDKNFKELLSNI